MCTIDEILPYSEETNVETNKVLAFVNKYREFESLIAGIDYFNGEDEYIEKYLRGGELILASFLVYQDSTSSQFEEHLKKILQLNVAGFVVKTRDGFEY